MDKFLAALRDLLKSDNATQQALFDAMYGKAEQQLVTKKDSNAAEIFAAMQEAIDVHKGSMNKVVEHNRAAWQAKAKELDTPKGKTSKNETIAIAGRAELEELAGALSAIDAPKVQAIVNAAAENGIAAENGLSLDTHFEGSLVTSINHTQVWADVKGNGVQNKTERSTTQGKISKNGAFEKRAKRSDIGGAISMYVVPGDLFANDRVDYSTLSDVAEGWLAKNNTKEGFTLPPTKYNGQDYGEVKLFPAGSGAANYRKNIEAVTQWLVRANNLKDKNGKWCNGKTFTGYEMHVGDQLATPEARNPIAPRQTSLVCETCIVNNTPNPEQIVVGGNISAVPIKPTIPVTPPVETPSSVHFNTRLPTASAEKGRINPYTESWYAELYAMSSMDVAKNHYALKNVTPNKRAHNEKQTGETEGFLKEGDWPRGNAMSKKDDDVADKKRKMNGKGYLGDDKGRPFTNGYVEKLNDDNSMQLKDGTVVRYIGHGYYASTDLGVTINYGKLPIASPIPAVYNPSKQLSLFSKTERYGLSQGHFVMAEVNLGGKDNLWADQKSWVSNAMESPDRIGAMMFLDYDKKYFEKKLQEVEKATDEGTKKAAATEVLKAFRDLKDNPLVRVADARAASTMAQNEKALEGFLKDQMKLDVASIKNDIKDLNAHPRILPTILSEEEQKELINMPAITKGAISGMRVEGMEKLYKVAADHVFSVQNNIEHQIAQGKANDLTEVQAVQTARDTWQQILRKDDGTVNEAAVRAYGEFLKRHSQGAGVEAGQGLSDLMKNPQNYNMKKDEAEKFVKELLGETEDGKKAFKDVDHVGKTRGSAWIPLSSVLTRDGAFAVTDAKAISDALAKTAQEKPELFAKFVETLSGEEKGKSDGRPHAIAMLHALGSERNYNTPENQQSTGLKAILATLSEEKATIVADRVRDIVAYTESGASGFSVNAREQSDNIMLKAVTRFNSGETIDFNALYSELTSTDSRKQFLAESLKTRPHMAADVVLATILRDPAAAKELENGLKDYGKGVANGLEEYGVLRQVIKRTRQAAEDYHKGGANVDDLVEATEKFAAYFHKMEAKAASSRAGQNIKADQRANAWDGLMTMIGESPKLSAALTETMGRNETLRDAFLQGVPNAAYIDNLRHGHVPTRMEAQSTMKDEYYAGSLFTLPTDSKGKVTRGGLFNRKHAKANKDEILNLMLNSTDDGVVTMEVTTAQNGQNTKDNQNIQGNQITSQLSDQGKADLDKIMNKMQASKILNMTNVIYLGHSEDVSKLQGAEYTNAIATRLLPHMEKMLNENRLFNKNQSGEFIPYTEKEVMDATVKLIEGGYVQSTVKAGDLVATPHMKAYDRLVKDLKNMNTEPGLDRKLALAFIRLPGEQITQLPPVWGQCPTCPIPGGRGG